MCLAGVLSVALGGYLTWSMGSDFSLALAVAGVLALGSMLCIVPALGRRWFEDRHWGLVVMGVSVTRTMVALGAMLIMLEVAGLPRKPVVYGVLAGTFVMMMVEAIVAVLIINQHDRRLQESKGLVTHRAQGSAPRGTHDGSDR
jgi:hypothetical protein